MGSIISLLHRTRSTGVIDKTAQFVAKCGEGFEQRVLREQNHTKFAFLLPNNPYRPYYEHKVREFKTGVVEETKPEVPQAIIDQKAKEDEKKKKKEQLKALTMGEKKKKQARELRIGNMIESLKIYNTSIFVVEQNCSKHNLPAIIRLINGINLFSRKWCRLKSGVVEKGSSRQKDDVSKQGKSHRTSQAVQ